MIPADPEIEASWAETLVSVAGIYVVSTAQQQLAGAKLNVGQRPLGFHCRGGDCVQLGCCRKGRLETAERAAVLAGRVTRNIHEPS